MKQMHPNHLVYDSRLLSLVHIETLSLCLCPASIHSLSGVVGLVAALPSVVQLLQSLSVLNWGLVLFSDVPLTKCSSGRIDVTLTTCRDSPIKTGELSTVACVEPIRGEASEA